MIFENLNGEGIRIHDLIGFRVNFAESNRMKRIIDSINDKFIFEYYIRTLHRKATHWTFDFSIIWISNLSDILQTSKT